MRRICKIASTSLFLIIFQWNPGYCAEQNELPANAKELRIVPVSPTPEPDHVTTKILFPRNGEVKSSSSIQGQIKLEGYALGTNSDFPRKKEIYNDNEGQALHIFIDNQPYFSVNEALIDALDDVEEYFDQTADFEIPFKLQPGMHVIRVFPVRSYNESLKDDGCFAASVFYYKKKAENPQIDLSAPYLTYNEPQGEYSSSDKEPILLDFYITNCQLSRDGYKVRLTIDNNNQRTLSSWQPYYIYGLKKGTHRIRLELLDPSNKPVNGLFNDIQRTIVIK
ncbi:MAG: hypothetical protein HYZ48_03660 [Chlamydiales bacterium]|nr:hypothetical protein [Chlamydiales bacterium]